MVNNILYFHVAVPLHFFVIMMLSITVFMLYLPCLLAFSYFYLCVIASEFRVSLQSVLLSPSVISGFSFCAGFGDFGSDLNDGVV